MSENRGALIPARERAYGRCLAVVQKRIGRTYSFYKDRCGNAAPKGFGTCWVHRGQEDML